MQLYDDGYGHFYEDADKAYAEWCLGNNWFDKDGSRTAIKDFSAGIYVCGEDVLDNEWEKWIVKQLAERG